MKTKRKIGVIALIGVVTLLIATPFFNHDPIKSEAAKDSLSIGIIGGADGPTAIFLASRNPLSAIAKFLGVTIVFVVGVVSLMKFGKKRKGL